MSSKLHVPGKVKRFCPHALLTGLADAPCGIDAISASEVLPAVTRICMWLRVWIVHVAAHIVKRRSACTGILGNVKTGMGSKNLYHRRLVADSGARACWICYKPSSTVLITPESDDWFHVCPGHLTDRKFAIPQDVEDQAMKKDEDAIQKEIEAVKKEFEEKMRKKLDRRRQKEHEQDGKSKKEETKKEDKKEDEQDEKEKEERLKKLEVKNEEEKKKAVVNGPRIFELNRNFFQMRLQKKRDGEKAKRDKERLRNMGGFPAVPSGNP